MFLFFFILTFIVFSVVFFIIPLWYVVCQNYQRNGGKHERNNFFPKGWHNNPDIHFIIPLFVLFFFGFLPLFIGVGFRVKSGNLCFKFIPTAIKAHYQHKNGNYTKPDDPCRIIYGFGPNCIDCDDNSIESDEGTPK